MILQALREKSRVMFLVTAAILLLASCGERAMERAAGRDRAEEKGAKIAPADDFSRKIDELGEWEPSLHLIPEGGLRVTEEGGEDLPQELVPDEDLWIIAKHESRGHEKMRRATPEKLMAYNPETGESLPLRSRLVRVEARITGFVASVAVGREYHNPFKERINATYSFSLPEGAGISDFLITIGARRIRGVVRERAEAETIFQLARDKGLVASLLEQKGANLFEETITNIEPGINIQVDLKYLSTLPYEDGAYKFEFPVGPPATSPPHEHTHLTVEMEAEVPVGNINSPSHEIIVKRHSFGHAAVHMYQPRDPTINRFVVFFQVAGDRVRPVLFGDGGSPKGLVNLLLIPPLDTSSLGRQPMEMIFLLDCSKSMRGKALYRAKRISERILDLLEPRDTFQVITFSGETCDSNDMPATATRSNIRQAIRSVHALPAMEGEGMTTGLETALTMAHSDSRLRIVLVLTDGYLDNASRILTTLRRFLGPARVFPMGIGPHVNRLLLESMALLGRGGVLYLELDTDESSTIDAFFQRISHPALTDITIEWGELEVIHPLPSPLPDLFVGRPVVIAAQYRNEQPTDVRVTGTLSGERKTFELHFDTATRGASNETVPFIWARKRMSELIYQSIVEPTTDVTAELREVALRHGLVSPFTSFIMVDTKAAH